MSSVSTKSYSEQSETKPNTSGSANSGSSKVSEESKNLKNDLKSVGQDVSNLAHATGDYAREQYDHAAEYADAGFQKAQQYHATCRRTVVKHPTAAVLTCLGVGIVIGRILGGR